ncbi:MAG: hypothetical protein ACQEQF_09105 [Bacillota bacterium]
MNNQMMKDEATITEVFSQFYNFLGEDDVLVYYGTNNYEIRFLDRALYKMWDEIEKFNYREKIKAKLRIRELVAQSVDLYSYAFGNVVAHFGFDLEYHRA